MKRAESLVPVLLEMARACGRAADLLSREIDVTRRRVNALEHILIPGILDAIHSIAARLEEMERWSPRSS